MSDDADLITLSQAAALVKNRNGNFGVHIATVFRWCISGCRGVKLWSTLRGQSRFTTRQALEEFFAALNGETPRAARPTKRRDEAALRAKEEKLAEMGV